MTLGTKKGILLISLLVSGLFSALYMPSKNLKYKIFKYKH